jgi:oxygen-independent coproporphyrinogen-3 oxidase
MATEGLGLYLHIPFCASRCRYCDFVTWARKEHLIPAYLEALVREIEGFHGKGLAAKTIYFGGGTPSLLKAEEIGGLLRAIGESFRVPPGAETTLEANPADGGLGYFKALVGLGVNRLSLGAQSFDDGELRLLGRRHGAADIARTFTQAREAGVENISLDLIYGLPGQGLGAFRQNLESALGLEPEHLSLYALCLEKATPLEKAVSWGELPDPDPDLQAEMYLLAEGLLDEAGYRHYELSNWAKPGRECRHNLIYWENGPYLGLGAGAHSYFQGHRSARVSSIEDYICRLESGESPISESEEIGPELEMAETMFLGLRLVGGVEDRAFARRFGRPPCSFFGTQIEELVGLALLEERDGCLSLTPRGRLLANQVFCRFLG